MRIRQLNVFPVKSAGGTSVPEAEVVATGLRHDREFMVIRPDGRHLSQREVPRLALVRPSFDGVKLALRAGGETLVYEVGDGAERPVTVHGQECSGLDQGDEAAGWLAGVLDVPCRLVRFAGERRARRGGLMTYADGEPLSVLSVESLDDLNARLESPVGLDRFRPNLVLEGLGPYAEDGLRVVRVGEVEIELIRPTGRCVIVNTDQETARRGREPLKVLGSYRARDFEGQRSIMFGRLGVPRRGGVIRVGDEVSA
ncbi:MOSC N-terminal beta barrel domain-containing protein [Spirillospora sp. NPDC047279]|uniref:MOSC domain-containing protein n=1 Tax=Spirillospora sp. NPDC047279 TaxID=3155478 RepID=UPI0033DDCBB4